MKTISLFKSGEIYDLNHILVSLTSMDNVCKKLSRGTEYLKIGNKTPDKQFEFRNGRTCCAGLETR